MHTIGQRACQSEERWADLLGPSRGGRRLLVAAPLALLVDLLVAKAPGRQGDGGGRVLEGRVELQRHLVAALCGTGVPI